MIKKLSFTLAFLAVMGWMSAQSLQFELDGYVFGQGEKIICTHVEDWGEMIQDMQVRNITSDSLDVMIKRDIIKIVPGTENSFCWGSCYQSDVNVSPRPQGLGAGAVSGEGYLSFHQVLDPSYSGDPANFIAGTSIVRYYAYPFGAEEDMVCIEVWFAYNADDVEENTVFTFGHAYPNPASSLVHFNYELSSAANASVSVYNLLGQEVLKHELNSLQGQAVLSVADLNDGIYFCNFVVDGRAVKTEKFVVKKY